MTAQAIRVTTPADPLSRHIAFPLFLATLYFVLLIVPWLLTNIVARNPQFLVRHEGDTNTYPLKPLYIDYSILKLINALDVIATFVSVPLLSALIARAAVVFAQRRHAKQKLTVRQLFALADRKWANPFALFCKSKLSWLLGFGWLVLAVAFALPIARSTSISYRSTTVDLSYPSGTHDVFVSRVPGPGALSAVSEADVLSAMQSQLKSTFGGIETTMWPYCTSKIGCGFSYSPYDLSHSTLSQFWTNNTDSMLATNVKAGTTTGAAADAYALALKSNSSCSAVSADDVAAGCASASFTVNSTIPGYLQVDICVPAPVGMTASPWSAIEDVEKSFTFTEDLYMGVQVESATHTGALDCNGDSCFSTYGEELYIHCQMGTTLGYFQLGNSHTGGVPGPILDRVPDSFDVPGSSDSASTVAGAAAPGPLMLTAQALFGSGSWFNLTASALSNVNNSQAMYAYIQMICSAIPLQNIDFFAYSRLTFYNPCEYSDGELETATSTANDSLITLAQVAIPFFSLFDSSSKAFAALETSAFYANDRLLNQALELTYSNSWIYYYDGNETLPVIPVITKPVFIGITTLMSLQIAIVVLLLVYSFRRDTWTSTLDAFAMATVGAQLARHSTALNWSNAPVDVLGVAVVERGERKNLLQLDGLIDTSVVLRSVTSQPIQQATTDMEMEDFLPAYSPNNEEGTETEGDVTRSVHEREPVERLSGEEAPPYSSRDVHHTVDEISEVSEGSLLGDVEREHSPVTSTSPALTRAQ